MSVSVNLNKYKQIWKIFLAAAVVFGVVSLAAFANGYGGWVARVNGKAIDKGTYDRRLDEIKLRYAGAIPAESDATGYDSFRRSVAEDLVVRELLREQAEQRGISITDADVDQGMEELKSTQFDGDQQKLSDALELQGIDEAQAREELKEGLLLLTVRNDVTRHIEAPSDDDVRATYERNPQKYEVAATVKLRQIQLTAEDDAVDAYMRLEQGEDMAAVARELSLDESTREQGGDMGWVPRGALDDQLEQAAFSLSPGGTSRPVQARGGSWHILRMEEFKPTYQRSLDEAREMIRSDLLEKSRDAYWSQWLDDLKSNASIEYNDGFKPLEV